MKKLNIFVLLFPTLIANAQMLPGKFKTKKAIFSLRLDRYEGRNIHTISGKDGTIYTSLNSEVEK